MFKGLGNLANLGEMMKQASQMGARVQEVQERMKSLRVTGEGGGGMVQIDMTGAQEVLAVRVDPGLVERGEREMIEDLTVAAMNDAIEKARVLHAEAMQEVTGGMNLPGMSDMLGKLGGEQQ
ncbi:YbaB/EbfC family nucleoid-associated protein [Botrimarina mediterranea]|uniref:Nucleoid-associated protein Spa11_03070 n=1 Tax=Botrimarina mediterranea TaxID=2528022 RepID=A0A518K307_9BACT|nr:YbaB/EbfC family nucleoid-associated protein [Botrimarina mediterranea]QDV72135.1 Nucleoid-associated protein YbaB [Botrimarina mediterranea]QDV76677.1 Nucleoid-associated protein YbaB [Planctomycetes bacterium K2D]